MNSMNYDSESKVIYKRGEKKGDEMGKIFPFKRYYHILFNLNSVLTGLDDRTDRSAVLWVQLLK